MIWPRPSKSADVPFCEEQVRTRCERVGKASKTLPNRLFSRLAPLSLSVSACSSLLEEGVVGGGRFHDCFCEGDMPKVVRPMGDQVGDETQRHHNENKAMQILGVVLHRRR